MDGYYGLRIGCYGKISVARVPLWDVSVVAMGIKGVAEVKWAVAKEKGYGAKELRS